MKKKSGKAGSLISPIAPGAAAEAVDAVAGELAEKRHETGAPKYAALKARPHRPPESAEEAETKKAWIEIELVDESENAVPGAKYAITLPDGSVASGTLDAQGKARVEGFEPGSCQVTFPDFDQEAWEKL